MSRNSYFGGSTTISSNGKGWSYDSCEESNPAKSKVLIGPKSKPGQKLKLKQIGTRVQNTIWKKHVELTADARIQKTKPSTYPIILQKMLRKPYNEMKFEQDVKSAIQARSFPV